MSEIVRAVKRIRKPKYIGDGICEVELTKGFVAWIDEQDAGIVGVCNWCVSFNARDQRPYVKGRPIQGSQKLVRLHRYLMGFPSMQVDHINLDTLDNRRANLRVVNQSQSNANRRPHKNKTVCFKGVSIRDSRYIATCNGLHVGTFQNAIEAAHAYDQAAIEQFGEYAATNASLGLYEVAQ